MSQTTEPLLQRPLYVFDLPQELLTTLELKAQNNAAVSVPDDADSIAASTGRRGENEDGPSSATSCGLCGLSFPSVQEQRSHVRSDLHGYNMKQKMRGLKAVGENDFEKLVGDLDESISGSDSDDSASSDDDGKKDTTLSALLKKQANIADADFDDFTTTKAKVGAGKPPLLWFSSSKLPSNVALGVYRTLLPPAIQVGDPTTILQTIKDKQLSPKPPPTQPTSAPTEESGGVPLPRSLQPDTSAAGPHYFLCMIGGGHFAAMVVSLTPKMTKKAGVEDRSETVLAHKTFHRYTTRRKQGGSQSANDSAKGAAHSAGAGIRRYNEAALIAEVRQLLHDWKVWIDSSELVFVRATGTTNRRTLFGPYEDQVLTSRDPRIRGFPFATRRATQAELMRSFVELTRVKVSTIDEAAIARKAQEEEAARQAAEAKAAAKPATPKPVKPSKEEEEATLHTTQLQALVRRSKAPALVSYITSNNLSPNFTFFPKDNPQNHHAPTPLHLAASLNAPALISSLLLKAKADPTVKSAEGKTAFEIAGDRATRDSFRLARSELGESAFDWDSAGVPAALSKADYDVRVQREKAEKAAEDAAEQQRRKTETERLRNEDKIREEQGKEKKFGKGKTLAQVLPEKTAQEKREEEARGMTPEMRMKLERERRARAAEARFKAMSGALYEDVITTNFGQVQGYPAFNSTPSGNLTNWRDITVWKGIPYAASTTGKNRWAAPKPAPNWNTTLYAKSYGDICPSTSSSPGYTISEDCLNLNIWTSATSTKQKRPVVMWSYPAYSTAADSLFDGSGMADAGIVYVNYNYRTGALGWLAHPELSQERVDTVGFNSSGNYGMLDQFAALKWIKENIEAFGGDPDHITVMGQSAGSAATQHILNSPLAKGLIVGAIIESGVRDPHDPLCETLAENYRNLTFALGQGVDYLADKNASTIAAARNMNYTAFVDSDFPPTSSSWTFTATLDHYALPNTYEDTLLKGAANDVPIITGNTRDESGATYGLNITIAEYLADLNATYSGEWIDKFLELYPANNASQASASENAQFTDRSIIGTWLWARKWKQAAKSPVYTYIWDHAPPGQTQGAYHESEINYVLNNLYGTDSPWTDKDYEIATTMNAYWVNFIKTGNPNGQGLTEWRESSNEEVTQRLGDGFESVPLTDPERVKLMEEWLLTQPIW
ncbi:hypothetical protein E4T42_07028 [Aureobasidium subglaciale]|nr:hypothetical protein E4T42_07028 [Aureobasidium subglaciale]